MTTFLDKSSNSDAKNYDNHTPLYLAIQNNDTEVVSFFIRRGALVSENLNSLLLMAIKKNNPTIVKMLIDDGMQCNPSADLNIPFDAAISQGSPKIIEHIIPHCQFLESSDKYIPRKLVIKPGLQNKESIELLLKWNFTIHPSSRNDEDFICAAVANGYPQIIVQLLNSGIDVNMVNSNTGLNLLAIACLNKHHQIVENLIQHDADVNVIISVKNTKLNDPFHESHNSWLFNRLLDNNVDSCSVTCLHIAVINNDSIMTELLLRYDAKIVNDPTFFDLTCMAIRNNFKELVRIFLAHGVIATDINSQGKTLLHFCVLSNKLNRDSGYDVAKMILEKGAIIHLHTPGNTLVYDAVKNGYRKTAQLFLDYNADVQYISPDGDTSLHKAIENRFNLEFITTLLKLKPPIDTVNRNGLTPFIISWITGSRKRFKIIEELLHHNINVNCVDNNLMTPLHFACHLQNLEFITVLLEKGANPNATNKEGRTPLHFVCEYKGHMTARIIQLLLEHNANIETVDAKGWTPLLVACDTTNYKGVEYHPGYDAVIKCFLDNNANLNVTNDEGQTPLHFVCDYDSDTTLEIVQSLVERNANVDAANAYGRTPLFVACEMGDHLVVKCLLDHHANPNHTDSQNLTPLYVAAQHSRYNDHVVNILLEYKADVHCIDRSGNTIIHVIVDNGNEQLIESLAHTDIDFNSVNKKGNTPLHNAVKDASVDMTKNLIKYGANINILDKDNLTPLQNAWRNMLHYQYKLRNFSKSKSVRNFSDNANRHEYTNQIEWNKEIIKAFKAQFVKLKAAKLKVNNHNWHTNYYFRNYDEDSEDMLKVECEEEVDKMKMEKIVTNITFQDLLKKNIHFLSRFVKNEEIQKTIKLKVYNKKYPLYIDIIRGRFRDAKFLYGVIISAREYFKLNITQQLPDECIDVIFSYFSIEELKMFIKVMKSLNG